MKTVRRKKKKNSKSCAGRKESYWACQFGENFAKRFGKNLATRETNRIFQTSKHK